MTSYFTYYDVVSKSAFFDIMLYSKMSRDLSILLQGVRGPACRSRHTGKKTKKYIKQKIDFDTDDTLLDMGQISISTIRI